MLLSGVPTCLPHYCCLVSAPFMPQTENIRIAYIDEIPAGTSSVTFKLNVVSVRQLRETPTSMSLAA